MAFGLSGALSGLSAVEGGYQEGQLDQLKIDDAKRAGLARKAMGNALQMLSGGGGMQPQQPMQQPGMSPQGAPQGMPQQPGMRPPGPPMGAGGPQPGPQPPPIQARPAQPGVATQGMQGLPQGNQPLDWRQLVAAVKQANPGIDPAVMAEAVNQFLPMMNAQSQQEWRMISLQMREQALQQRQDQFYQAEAGRNTRASAAEEGRTSRAQDAEAGREERATAGREQRQQQFEQREQRLGDALKLREDSTWARLEQQKQQALQRAQASQGKQGLAELRAIIDAQDKHVRTQIMAYSSANTLKPAERKKLLDQADMDYNEQIVKLREQFGRSTPTGGTTQEPDTTKGVTRPAPGSSSKPNPDAVVIVQTPEEAQKLAPGTKYKTPDGQEYTR